MVLIWTTRNINNRYYYDVETQKRKRLPLSKLASASTLLTLAGVAVDSAMAATACSKSVLIPSGVESKTSDTSNDTVALFKINDGSFSAKILKPIRPSELQKKISHQLLQPVDHIRQGAALSDLLDRRFSRDFVNKSDGVKSVEDQFVLNSAPILSSTMLSTKPKAASFLPNGPNVAQENLGAPKSRTPSHCTVVNRNPSDASVLKRALATVVSHDTSATKSLETTLSKRPLSSSGEKNCSGVPRDALLLDQATALTLQPGQRFSADLTAVKPTMKSGSGNESAERISSQLPCSSVSDDGLMNKSSGGEHVILGREGCTASQNSLKEPLLSLQGLALSRSDFSLREKEPEARSRVYRSSALSRKDALLQEQVLTLQQYVHPASVSEAELMVTKKPATRDLLQAPVSHVHGQGDSSGALNISRLPHSCMSQNTATDNKAGFEKFDRKQLPIDKFEFNHPCSDYQCKRITFVARSPLPPSASTLRLEQLKPGKASIYNKKLTQYQTTAAEHSRCCCLKCNVVLSNAFSHHIHEKKALNCSKGLQVVTDDQGSTKELEATQEHHRASDVSTSITTEHREACVRPGKALPWVEANRPNAVLHSKPLLSTKVVGLTSAKRGRHSSTTDLTSRQMAESYRISGSTEQTLGDGSHVTCALGTRDVKNGMNACKKEVFRTNRKHCHHQCPNRIKQVVKSTS